MSSQAPLLPLLPARALPVGRVLLGLGATLGVVVFYFGKRPSIFDARVFAIHSTFFETRSLVWIHKNVSVETTLALVLVGLYCLAFSREPDESPTVSRLRARALAIGVTVNTLVLLLALVTVFGVSFVYVLTANTLSTLGLTALVFRVSLFRLRHAP